MVYQNALWVLVTIAVSFWVGVIVARILPDGDPKQLIDLAIAVGTIGAVVVALWQSGQGRRESRSRAYRDAAVRHLELGASNFLENRLENGRPMNTRRHWLNFSRAIQVSRRLASRIELPEQREIWIEQEHLLREQIYDVLEPLFDSYPAEYYRGPTARPGHQRDPGISEPSLVVIYGWVEWPKDLPDPLDRTTRFTEERLDYMRSFGPRGAAQYIDSLRPQPLNSSGIVNEAG
jgi:hypothetical protein